MIEKLVNTSAKLFERAKQSIPGGVNSPVRAFKSVGGDPVFFQRAKGAYMYDADGNEYIDYINSWGPMILGHGHPKVTEALQNQIEIALSFGAPTELEIEMAELIKGMVPNVDLIRMVSSGTEACMSAVRLARGYTGKNKIVKFEGCYHGHADCFLVKAGSGMATLNIQTVPGITSGVSNDTIALPYNDKEAIRSTVESMGKEIAAIIIEPVAGNMGCVLPEQGYLELIRELCNENNIVFIFDEVMTGFRLALGGAQEKLKVDADLVTYGKVIGGGLPVGAFGGKRKIMEHIAPLGSVYQAGTLSGNPLAMTAGFATLSVLKNDPQIYNRLDKKTSLIKNGLAEIFNSKGISHSINHLGSMISIHFGEHPVKNFSDASNCKNEIFNKYFHFMLDHGVYLPPSSFETWFISDALSLDDIDRTLQLTRKFELIG